MKKDAKTIAKTILQKEFSYNSDAFNEAEKSFEKADTSGDKEAFEFWQSVFIEVLILWREGSGNLRSLEDYHLFMSTAMFAEGVSPLSEKEVTENLRCVSEYQKVYDHHGPLDETPDTDDEFPF